MIVRALKYRVPELEIPQPVELAVIVPLLGAKVLPEATVKVPPNEKLALG